MHYFFIIGTVILLLFCLICRLFSLKAKKELSVKDRMLFITQVTNINKYSISVLIAVSVLFFAGMRQLNFFSSTMILIFIIIVFVYTTICLYFLSREIKLLKLPAKVTFYYIISRASLLLGLGIFILTLFLSFSNITVIVN